MNDDSSQFDVSSRRQRAAHARRRGTVQLEHIILIVSIAIAGLAGARFLGGAIQTVISGD